jgi:hypothetical protein
MKAMIGWAALVLESIAVFSNINAESKYTLMLVVAVCLWVGFLIKEEA